MAIIELPRRVKNLQEELKKFNGHDAALTPADSRKIIKMIGETQLDLWDVVLKMQTNLSRIAGAAWAVAAAFIVTVLGWLSTSILPEILSIIAEHGQ